jgi:hypothetical protein
MRLILFLFLFALCSTTYAQTADYLIVQGQVVNSKTGKPLPYAHVGIPERSIGTTTGYDGAFTLKVPALYRNSMLTVSYIGFRNYKQALGKLSDPVIIRLQPISTTLQEVVVMDESRIEDIIRRAVRSIPDNYPDRPSNLTAFYRESRTNAEQEYVYLAEGVLKLYKTSYKNDKEGQVGLIQGRQIALVSEEEFQKRAQFSSGHLASDRFDIVKHRADFIKESFFSAYEYRLENLTEQDGKAVYVIGFDRQGDNTKARMKGKVYIDTLSYAFVRAEYEILPDAQQKYNDYPYYTGNWKANSYSVNYREGDGRWHFSDALREGVYRDNGMYTNEIIITEVLPGRGKVVPYMERLDRNDRFLDLTGTYDEDFWANYNTAPINDPKLAERIASFQSQEKATEVFDTAYVAQLQRQQDSTRQVQSQDSSSSTGFIPTIPRFESDDDSRFPLKMQFSYGLGAHGLRSEAAQYRLAYQMERDDPEAVLIAENPLEALDYEPIYQLALDLVYDDWLLLRWNLGRDLWTNIYRESAIGLGAQVNLTKKRRPFFVRPMVQYSRLFYGRRVGKADNDYGNFEVDDKKFKADKVRLFYGERQQQLKLSLEMAIELNPARELFVRFGYHMPFNNQQRLFLRESGRLFRKRARTPVSGATVVTRNGEAFNGTMSIDEPSFSLTVGILMK